MGKKKTFLCNIMIQTSEDLPDIPAVPLMLLEIPKEPE